MAEKIKKYSNINEQDTKDFAILHNSFIEIEGLVKNFCEDCSEYERCDYEKDGCYYSIVPRLKDIIKKNKEKIKRIVGYALLSPYLIFQGIILIPIIAIWLIIAPAIYGKCLLNNLSFKEIQKDFFMFFIEYGVFYRVREDNEQLRTKLNNSIEEK